MKKVSRPCVIGRFTPLFPKEADLNEAEHIFDVDRYVQANLNDIKAHYPDPFYHPAITRLYLLKDIMEGKDTE